VRSTMAVCAVLGVMAILGCIIFGCLLMGYALI
jgi:hypothetical protein